MFLRPNPNPNVSQPENLVPDTKVPCKKAVHTLVSGTKREDFRQNDPEDSIMSQNVPEYSKMLQKDP